MADFLPSRSVLSVCFPGCVLTSGEAEQQRKSKEIDKCLSREKTYVKRLVKILLLGAGESGKSTFLKQMRIIHGQDFDQRAREEFRPTIYSNVIKGAGGPGPGGRGPVGRWARPRAAARGRAPPSFALSLAEDRARRAGRGRGPGERMPGGDPFSPLPPGQGARRVPTPNPAAGLAPCQREVRRAGCSGAWGDLSCPPSGRAKPRPSILTPRRGAARPASPPRLVGDPSHMGSGLLPIPEPGSSATAAVRKLVPETLVKGEV